MKEAWVQILLNLVAASLFFLLGIAVSNLPRSIRKFKFRKFFGPLILSSNARVVYGEYSSLPSKRRGSAAPSPRMQKVYQNGTTVKLEGVSKLITPSLIRGYSYIVQELGTFRKEPLDICPDHEAIRNLDRTFISIGGPITNELTQWILNEKANVYFGFESLDDAFKENWKLNVTTKDGNKVSFQQNQGKDYGFILKIRNSRFPEHYFFLCSGLGSWSTSAAAWYLSHHWSDLYKEFKTNEFGILLEVKQGSDTSASRVIPTDSLIGT